MNVRCFGPDGFPEFTQSTDITSQTVLVTKFTTEPRNDGVTQRQTENNNGVYPLHVVIIAAVVPSIIAIIIVIFILIMVWKRIKQSPASHSEGAVSFDNSIYNVPEVHLQRDNTSVPPPPLPNGNITRNHSHTIDPAGEAAGYTEDNDTDSVIKKDLRQDIDGKLEQDLYTETSRGHNTHQPVYEKLSLYQSK